MRFDDIIVGAGSAGCVLAARLSEDPRRQVLLVESGEDHPEAERLPPELAEAQGPVLRGHNWAFTARARAAALPGAADAAPFDYPMGRVVGGSSAVNAALAIRGTPEDYDGWAALGNPAWAWDTVLPWFRSLENDEDVQGPHHGRGGPLPISRAPHAALEPIQRDFGAACEALGFAQGDPNDPHATGWGRVPRCVRGTRRLSAALAYLAPARSRPNLTILPRTLVDRVLMRGTQAVGIAAAVEGRPLRLEGRRIVLCAGAIHTPAILMRSGLGPAGALGALGIQPVQHLPGVGANLIDHPGVIMWFVPAAGACAPGGDFHQVLLRHSSSEGRHRNDLQLFMLSSVRTALFPELEAAIGMPMAAGISTMLAKPVSRGQVTLGAKQPDALPLIDLNLAAEPSDLARLMEGVRCAWSVAQSQPLAPRLGPWLSGNQRIIDSDDLLRRRVLALVRGCWHPVGTARMGPAADPMAVVDQHGVVHGCSQLRVADASVMPSIPSAPTHLSCVMVGERMASWMRDASDA